MSLSILYDGSFLINSTKLPFTHMQNRIHKGPIRNKINIAQKLLVQSPHNISFKSIRYETRDRKVRARTSRNESAKKYSLIPVRTDLHTKFITEIYQLVNISL